MTGTFLRFDFKLFLINWSIAALISGVLKLADAPNLHIHCHSNIVGYFLQIHLYFDPYRYWVMIVDKMK